MNPARSLDPALVSGELGQAWIFLAGPLAGALLAVALASALRRPQLIWPPRVVVDSKRQKSASAALRRQNDESCGQGRHDHPRDLGDRCPDDTGEHASRLMSQHGSSGFPAPFPRRLTRQGTPGLGGYLLVYGTNEAECLRLISPGGLAASPMSASTACVLPACRPSCG